jgi:transcription initiation factor TFIID TATA-box-binding protein
MSYPATRHLQLTPWHNETPDIADPQVHNIVSTSMIQDTSSPHESILLQIVANSLPCCKYTRSKFAAMTIRMHNPKCTALLFTTGKLVVTGGNNWYECMLTAMHIATLINKVFYNKAYTARGCDLQNIVAHTRLSIQGAQRLDIACMYQNMGLECTYQPSIFPGLSYRPIGSPVVILCFQSGNIVVTGAKELHHIKVSAMCCLEI